MHARGHFPEEGEAMTKLVTKLVSHLVRGPPQPIVQLLNEENSAVSGDGF